MNMSLFYKNVIVGSAANSGLYGGMIRVKRDWFKFAIWCFQFLVIVLLWVYLIEPALSALFGLPGLKQFNELIKWAESNSLWPWVK